MSEPYLTGVAVSAARSSTMLSSRDELYNR
jgi:hypothetical protein